MSEQKLETKCREKTITGMSYILCPDCKRDFSQVVHHKEYSLYCKHCDRFLSVRQTLRGWLVNTFLKNDYITKIWDRVISKLKNPLCPNCKTTLRKSNCSCYKEFKCPTCDSYYEKREFLQAWIIEPIIEEQDIDKIWKEIIQEISKNRKESVKNALKRHEFASKCKYFNNDPSDSKYIEWRCKKPRDHNDGFCYLATQFPVDCYEKRLEEKPIKKTEADK